jgi:predicted RNase H-like HicB family nuclease
MAEHVIALVHNEDDAYGISFPDFPGVASGGASLDEAVRRGTATLGFHVAGMVEDGEGLPVLRSIEELRRDRDFRADAKGAVVVAVPVELPGKAMRINISMDERLLSAIDREAAALGETRSAFLANAARARMQKVA